MGPVAPDSPDSPEPLDKEDFRAHLDLREILALDSLETLVLTVLLETPAV